MSERRTICFVATKIKGSRVATPKPSPRESPTCAHSPANSGALISAALAYLTSWKIDAQAQLLSGTFPSAQGQVYLALKGAPRGYLGSELSSSVRTRYFPALVMGSLPMRLRSIAIHKSG